MKASLRRTIRVRSYRRKGKSVRRHARRILVTKKGIITSPYRQIFTAVSSDPFKNETGGLIDFGKTGKIERWTTDIGTRDQTDRLITEDFEVLWHTHPGKGKEVILPSPTDLAGLTKDREQQAEIIFNNGKALGIAKTPRVKKLQKKSTRKLEDYFFQKYMDAEKVASADGRFNQDKYIHAFTEGLEDDGFVVFRAPANAKDITVPIKIKEPKDKGEEE